MDKRLVFTEALLVLPLIAGTITRTFTFSMDDLCFEKVQGYDVVKMLGESETKEIGSPLLPKKMVDFLIPPGAEIVSATVVKKQEEVIPGSFQIIPCQKPYPLSKPEVFQFTLPDKRVYSSNLPYPGKDAEIYSSGSKSGYRICGIGIYPIHYVPSQDLLILTRSIDIQIEYIEGKHNIWSLTERQAEIFSGRVAKLIENPEDVMRLSPRIRDRNLNDVEYVIITSDALESSFQPIAYWRTKQGWLTEIKTTTWIYANYSGIDNQEKIRNFIKDYWANKGLIFVLLGGDVGIVPVRKAYLPCYGDPYIATDLYYSDLDGNWNANNNSFWGEMVGDGVDIYADVLVGRIPARTAVHVTNYINKENVFEKNPPTDYLKKILLPSVKLFFWGYHGREVNNAIADTTPLDWFDSKLEDPPNFLMRDSLNRGYQYCHPAAHGSEYGFYTDSGTPIFTIDQVASLTNDTNYNIMNSIACYTGDFDEYNCIAESLVNKYPGACVATIMNTRLGWGALEGFGYSEKIDIMFYGYFFNYDILEIGHCHSISKDAFRNDALTDTVARYCICELTLFGDPALPMWENLPLALTVDHPEAVPSVSQNITVTVMCSGNPVSDALVCLYKPGEVHETGYTNTLGRVTLSINPLTDGIMNATVTAKDCYPYEGTILVEAGMPLMPVVIKPLDYARLPDSQPTLSFYSTDPDNDNLQYRILWDTDPDFATPESITTTPYPSGSIVDFIFPSALIDNETYWWKVKCTDPDGSGYWTLYTSKRSFTVSTILLPGTCSWFQTTAAQFDANTFAGTMIEGDSVILVPTSGTAVDTIFEEHFEDSGIPPGWTVIDGNSDGVMWTVGTTDDIGAHTPPDYGTKYAYYSDDDAGSGSISYNEELISTAIYAGDITEDLELIYGYGFYPYESGETFRVKLRKKIGGTWSAWMDLKIYTVTGSGTEVIDLTSYLPADSLQFDWLYSDSTASSHWGYACAFDNVILQHSYAVSNDYGTMIGVPVSYHDLSVTYPRSHWGDAAWHKAGALDSIGIQVEFLSGSNWLLVPDELIPNNSIGNFTNLAVDTISLVALDTITYGILRLQGLFHRKTDDAPNEPALLNWEVGNLSNYSIVENGTDALVVPVFMVYPTVFNKILCIRFSVSKREKVTLRVYDVSGRCLKTLLDNQSATPAESGRTAGLKSSVQILSWDGRDDMGRVVPAGVYFVRLEAVDQKQTRKVILLR